jgi:L-fuculose-phosphate aldolase
MIEIGRRMYERGYVAGTDGNLSLRLPCGNILATPAGTSKGHLDTSDLVITDTEGNVIGNGRPSSELKVHLAAYQLRPEIGAVVHAHPKAAVAHSLAGVSLSATIIPETVFTLGMIAAAEYDTPGSTSLAERVGEAIRCHDAIIMERHGSLTLGADLFEAYYRLESLEHTAQILLMARSLGQVDPLPGSEVERLFAIAEEAGASWRFRNDPTCRSSDCNLPAAPGENRESLVNELVERVLGKLRQE